MQRTPSWRRVRTREWYIALALGTIALGLSVHWRGSILGPALRDILGDALWAAMIVWWVGAITPDTSLGVRAAVALALCAGVEVSQLYHTPMLDMARSTTVGQLVLGTGFDARDLASYTFGVLAAVFLERAVARTSPS